MVAARKGSERLKRKNYIKIGNYTVLELAIIKAIESNVFDKIFINTDDEALENLAKLFKIDFYLRSPHLANSTVTSDQVVLDFFENNDCEKLYWVNTASPLQTIQDIKKFFDSFENTQCDASVSSNNILQHAYYENNPINFQRKNGFAKTQDLKTVQALNYAMMAWKRSCINNLKNGELFSENTLILESSRWSGFLLKTNEDFEIIRNLYKIAPDQGHKNS